MFVADTNRVRDEHSNLERQLQTMQSEYKTDRARLLAELQSAIEERNLIASKLQSQIEENKNLQSQLVALKPDVDAKGKGF